MKKILLLFLIALMSLTITGCNTTVKNSDDAAQTMELSPTPRTLEERSKELDVLQVEAEWLEKNKDSYETREYIDKLDENLRKQTEIINGANGEPKYNDVIDEMKVLYERIIWANEQAEKTGDDKYKDESDRLFEQYERLNNDRPEQK